MGRAAKCALQPGAANTPPKTWVLPTSRQSSMSAGPPKIRTHRGGAETRRKTRREPGREADNVVVLKVGCQSAGQLPPSAARRENISTSPHLPPRLRVSAMIQLLAHGSTLSSGTLSISRTPSRKRPRNGASPMVFHILYGEAAAASAAEASAALAELVRARKIGRRLSRPAAVRRALRELSASPEAARTVGHATISVGMKKSSPSPGWPEAAENPSRRNRRGRARTRLEQLHHDGQDALHKSGAMRRFHQGRGSSVPRETGSRWGTDPAADGASTSSTPRLSRSARSRSSVRG